MNYRNLKLKILPETFETNVYPVFWTVQKALEYLQPGGQLQQHLQFKVIILVQFFMIMRQRKLQLYL